MNKHCTAQSTKDGTTQSNYESILPTEWETVSSKKGVTPETELDVSC